MNIDDDYKYFYKALRHHVPDSKRREGIQKELHFETKISQSMLSQICSGYRNASHRNQVKIAQALGYRGLDECISFGRSLIQPNITEPSISMDIVEGIVTETVDPLSPPSPIHSDSAAAIMSRNLSHNIGSHLISPDKHIPALATPELRSTDTDHRGSIRVLTVKGDPSPIPDEIQAQAMRDNLEIIIQSGDMEIIETIKSNLLTFKRMVEQAMEIRELKSNDKTKDEKIDYIMRQLKQDADESKSRSA